MIETEKQTVRRPPPGSRIIQIYEAAARLFVERGYTATTLSDIASAVGITKAGIYHFIRTKEDLVNGLVAWAFEVYERDVDRPARLIADPMERLRFIVSNHLRNIGRHRVAPHNPTATGSHATAAAGNPMTVLLDDRSLPLPLQQAIVARQKGHMHLLRDTLAALAKRGELEDIDPTVAAFTLLGMIIWLSRWHRTDGRLSLDEIVHQMTGAALRSVVRPEALEQQQHEASGALRDIAKVTRPRQKKSR